ncbi:hypothetical protein [Mycobacteroides abscessus]|uniref:hypothetical protein n=1 Tax=Mycobacteroides abscessus TaxID=36809 RepID=UPI0009A66ED3|nr:hypothetical protein [Mycobacteroides abscessus]MBN7314141.1 hypothetical protein [Mycobacteroides abscessus subsp. abscessus]SKG10341.1 Uncharacterised protein [Mycobacteroides abscessus subsp. massiliense]
MAQKEPASAGQWAGSLIFAGGLVGAFLAGQMAKNGSLAVGSFGLALVGLGIYLVSVVGQAAAANRQMQPRPEQPIVEDYPEDWADDDQDDEQENPRAANHPVLREKGIRASGDQATGQRGRGFLSSLGDGTTSLPHTNDR